MIIVNKTPRLQAISKNTEILGLAFKASGLKICICKSHQREEKGHESEEGIDDAAFYSLRTVLEIGLCKERHNPEKEHKPGEYLGGHPYHLLHSFQRTSAANGFCPAMFFCHPDQEGMILIEEPDVSFEM
jgi:hypothetical protein